jgi:CRP-like cAMP-binding protein
MFDPFQVLRTYLIERAGLIEPDLDFVVDRFVPRTLPAGDFLQRAGDVSEYSAFVASGCLRSYVIDPKGKEHIVQFGPETWWVGDTRSLTTQTPSQFFIDAVEDSIVLLVDLPSHNQIVDNIPAYAAAHRIGLHKRTAALNERIVSAMSATAEERYLDFLKTYPSVATRVPQWMQASYLGVTPETVSRIRRKLARKKKS